MDFNSISKWVLCYEQINNSKTVGNSVNDIGDDSSICEDSNSSNMSDDSGDDGFYVKEYTYNENVSDHFPISYDSDPDSDIVEKFSDEFRELRYWLDIRSHEYSNKCNNCCY